MKKGKQSWEMDRGRHFQRGIARIALRLVEGSGGVLERERKESRAFFENHL